MCVVRFYGLPNLVPREEETLGTRLWPSTNGEITKQQQSTKLIFILLNPFRMKGCYKQD